MAHVSKEMKQKLAPTIKAICKKHGVKATLAVRHHSSLVLNIKSGVIDFAEDYSGEHFNYQVNTYHPQYYSGKARAFLDEIIPAMKGPDFFDKSDAQQDYFCVSHYIDINVGQWNKPYVVE